MLFALFHEAAGAGTCAALLRFVHGTSIPLSCVGTMSAGDPRHDGEGRSRGQFEEGDDRRTPGT